jgi:hypothetical protein
MTDEFVSDLPPVIAVMENYPQSQYQGQQQANFPSCQYLDGNVFAHHQQFGNDDDSSNLFNNQGFPSIQQSSAVGFEQVSIIF